MVAVTRFRLLPDVAEVEFRSADARYQMEFAYQQPGLLRRTTAFSDEGEWIVIELWRDEVDLDACLEAASGSLVAQVHEGMVDQSTVRRARYRDLDG